MEIRFALRDVMRRFGVKKRGGIAELTKRLRVTRQTASKIVNGRTGSVSFSQLGLICEWLLTKVTESERRRQLRELLPGVLLRFAGPLDLLREVDQLVLHLGVRYWAPSEEPDVRSDAWIAGADSSVATSIVRRLTDDGARFRQLNWGNVPLHLSSDRKIDLKADRGAAQARLKELHSTENIGSLMIGSQRVNLLTEVFVADLFGCEPFVPPTAKTPVPVYLRYRQSDRKALPDSCFGSPHPPPGPHDRDQPGCYWRPTPTSPWRSVPFVPGKSDAGIVIVAEEANRNAVQIALFGYSARSTQALGDIFCSEPHRFWPLAWGRSSRRFGVFVCACSFDANQQSSWTVTAISPREAGRKRQ